MENFFNAIAGFFRNFGQLFYDDFIYKERYMLILKGLGNTILISFCSVLIGILLGIIIAVVKVAHNANRKSVFINTFNVICTIYINVIRGTPVVVQLLITNFIIFASSSNAIAIAIITFGINSGAYVAEIMRAGIMAVDRGQTEAGRSLGLPSSATMIQIILPQAIKNILPALCNEFISLLKETSVAGYIAIEDLTKAGDMIRYATFDAFLPLIMVALIYLVIVLGLTKVVGIFEKKLAKSDR